MSFNRFKSIIFKNVWVHKNPKQGICESFNKYYNFLSRICSRHGWCSFVWVLKSGCNVVFFKSSTFSILGLNCVWGTLIQQIKTYFKRPWISTCIPNLNLTFGQWVILKSTQPGQQTHWHTDRHHHENHFFGKQIFPTITIPR